jgi:hypothetical protein
MTSTYPSKGLRTRRPIQDGNTGLFKRDGITGLDIHKKTSGKNDKRDSTSSGRDASDDAYAPPICLRKLPRPRTMKVRLDNAMLMMRLAV